MGKVQLFHSSRRGQASIFIVYLAPTFEPPACLSLYQKKKSLRD